MPQRRRLFSGALAPALALSILGVALAGCSTTQHGVRHPTESPAAAHEQVVATERAFARTMADRDFTAFASFLSSEAIFFSGTTVERGAAAIEAAWKPYFHGPTAPFSWSPDSVEVLPSGKLAISTGPVMVQGKQVGRFNSIWRLEQANTWHIVFDKGEAICGPGTNP